MHPRGTPLQLGAGKGGGKGITPGRNLDGPVRVYLGYLKSYANMGVAVVA